MAHLLLLTDFSADALHAAHYAAELFGGEKNTFTAVHVWSDGGLSGSMTPTFGPEMQEICQEDLDGFVDRFQQLTGASAVQQELGFGPLPHAVDEVTGRRAADLVVMGTRGRGRAALLGSSARNVIRAGHVPVLAVPPTAPLRPPGRILLADDHLHASARELDVLRRIAAMHRSQVIIAHVQGTASTHAGYWTDGSYDIGLPGVMHSYREVVDRDVVEGLARTATRESADMLVMLHRHLGLLGRILDPGTSQRMVLRTEVPLLVLQHARERAAVQPGS